MKSRIFIFCILLTSVSLYVSAKASIAPGYEVTEVFPLVIASPDNRLRVELNSNQTSDIIYSFSANAKLIISDSKLGLNGIERAVPIGCSHRSNNTVWKPLWGKRASVPDSYNEVKIELTTYTLIIRAYNEGIAFRYEIPQGKPEKDLTEFNFAGNYTAWYYNGERANIGPEKLMDCSGKRFPVMTVKVDKDNYVAIHEANLSWGEPLVLQSRKQETRFDIASKPSDSWKVVMYGDKPGSLVDSHILELLNPPPAKSTDFSWVKPGVSVWDWRIAGAQVDGFRYDMSLASWKKMVDFASKNNIRYLSLDADWYGPEFGQQSDPLKGGKVAEVHEIIKYAKTKGVRIWLYLNDVGGRKFPIAQTLKQYGDWGAAGIKYGFMSGTAEEKNERTRMITELCAKNRLLCNFHDGPVHPYGQMRTFPNALTREYCQAQLDAGTPLQPKTFVTSVFVNMLAGPLDMNNGLADLLQTGRTHGAAYPTNTTLAGEAARTLITFSGVTVIPDLPENYQKHPELLKFISSQKMPWLESKTLDGEIGEFIVMARQANDKTWLIGAATNEKGRDLDIPIDFLKKGKFKAIIIQDGDHSDYRKPVESYKVMEKEVGRNDTLHVRLAPGGGACILITK